jgi:hypothetical protein
MVGTTFKLGFDGTSVKKGLAGLGGTMKSFGKQVAIGGARQIGAGMTDLLGKVITMLPEAVMQTMDWAGQLRDLADQTGASTDDLMALGEAFKMAGMESVDAGKMLGTMQKNLYEAGHGDQSVQDALQSLGLNSGSFGNMDPIERMKKIMNAMDEMKAKLAPGQMEDISTTIFGGKAGFKLLRMFHNLPGSLADAKAVLGDLAKTSTSTLESMDNLGDRMLGRFEAVKMLLAKSFMEGAFGEFMNNGTRMVDNMATIAQQLAPAFRSLGEMIQPMIQAFNDIVDTIRKIGMTQFLDETFQSIGESIGKGMKKQLNLGSMIFGSSDNNSTSMNSSGPLLNETRAQTTILERIYSKNPTAIFA